MEDVLGPEYSATRLPLQAVSEGEVVATLVSRGGPSPSGKAVLYVHGFSDYFFQTHLADFYLERGFDFYALDLRKYGRSLLPHQTPNFALSMSAYFEEIDEALRIIRAHHDVVRGDGHATGGLNTALRSQRAKRRRTGRGAVPASAGCDLN